MRQLTIRLLLLGIWLFATVWTTPAAAEGRPPIHVQLVLDSSGSMKENDATRLSALAGMIFTDLAGPQDWVGVLSMQKGRFITEPVAKIEDRRDKVRASIRRLAFSGPTFCSEPLEHAHEGLAALRDAQPDARQFVVFLSDGACPDDHHRGPDDVRRAAAQLADARVKVFSIGLFGDFLNPGVDPTADLRTMASVTDGEFFKVEKAADLPETFASILGRIVGSEAVPVQLTPGADASAELDGYVYDASFIATGSGAAVIFDKAAPATGSALALPRRTNTAAKDAGFHVAAFGNERGQHYSVLRIDEPQPGTWTIKVDGPKNLQGLLIQNYALDPVVEMKGATSVFPVGADGQVVAWLRGQQGAPITDASFLEKVEFTAYVTGPRGRERELKLTAGKEGRFSGEVELDEAGTWLLRGRARMKSGGLDKRTAPTKVEVRASTLAMAADQTPIDLGEVKAGSTAGPFPCDLGASELPAELQLRIRVVGAEGVEAETTSATIHQGATTVDESFIIAPTHPGGRLAAQLVFEGDGQTVSIPVTGVIIPLTLWERWGRLLIVIGVGLLGLLLLIFVVKGIVSPHSFPASARLNWGASRERLDKNEVVIRELPGTGRGFYRNASLTLGGARGIPAEGARLGTIEATGPSRLTLTAAEGAELRRVNKFDDAKTTLVEGNATLMQSGEIYQIGEIYFRLR